MPSLHCSKHRFTATVGREQATCGANHHVIPLVHIHPRENTFPLSTPPSFREQIHPIVVSVAFRTNPLKSLEIKDKLKRKALGTSQSQFLSGSVGTVFWASLLCFGAQSPEPKHRSSGENHLHPYPERGAFQCSFTFDNWNPRAKTSQAPRASSVSHSPRVPWDAKKHIRFGVDKICGEERDDQNGNAHNQSDYLGRDEKHSALLHTQICSTLQNSH